MNVLISKKTGQKCAYHDVKSHKCSKQLCLVYLISKSKWIFCISKEPKKLKVRKRAQTCVYMADAFYKQTQHFVSKNN